VRNSSNKNKKNLRVIDEKSLEERKKCEEKTFHDFEG